MKRKFLIVLLMSCLIIFNCIPGYAATLTHKIPDFEGYLELSGFDINDYSHYYIGLYEDFDKDSSLGVCNRWYIILSNVAQHITEVSSSSYLGCTTFKDGEVFCFGSIYTDDSGKVLKYTFSNSTNGNTTHDFYIWSGFEFLYSNYNVFMNYSDGTLETVFYVAPYSQGQKVTIGTAISHQVMLNLLEKQIVSLIPLALPLAISFMALRKGLIALFRLLARI